MASAPSSVASSYAIPSITSLSVVSGASSLTALSTAGGAVVALQGVGYGPLSSNITAYFAAAGVVAQASSTVVNCTVTSTDVTAFCPIPAGVGANLAWTVVVGGQSSGQVTARTMSYAPPTLTAVAVPGGTSSTMQTTGGDTIALTGTNFGPVGTGGADIVVKYGLPGTQEYIATACSVSTAHTTVQCTSVAGVGAGHSWMVTVRGQSTGWQFSSAVNTSYALSSVTGFPGITAMNTAGGENVLVSGSNFGPTGTSLRCFYRNSLGTMYKCSTCSVSVGSSQVQCGSVAGVGGGVQWLVEVAGRNGSAWSTATMSYGAPTISSQVGSVVSLATSGGTVVTLAGSNFGAVGAASVSGVYSGGTTGLSYTASCAVTVDHVQMACTTVAGVGGNYGWTLTVAGVSSGVLMVVTSSYAAPSISGLSAGGADALTSLPTSGSSIIVIQGRDFGVHSTYKRRLSLFVRFIVFAVVSTVSRALPSPPL